MSRRLYSPHRVHRIMEDVVFPKTSDRLSKLWIPWPALPSRWERVSPHHPCRLSPCASPTWLSVRVFAGDETPVPVVECGSRRRRLNSDHGLEGTLIKPNYSDRKHPPDLPFSQGSMLHIETSPEGRGKISWLPGIDFRIERM